MSILNRASAPIQPQTAITLDSQNFGDDNDDNGDISVFGLFHISPTMLIALVGGYFVIKKFKK